MRHLLSALVPYFPQNPNSYMSFAPLPDVYLDLDILLSFRPESTDGLLLYNGQHTQTNGDFVCFGLSGAVPEFRFDVGSGPAIIRGKNPLELNKWHTVHLRREKKNGGETGCTQELYSGASIDGCMDVCMDIQEHECVNVSMSQCINVYMYESFHSLNFAHVIFVLCTSAFYMAFKRTYYCINEKCEDLVYESLDLCTFCHM